MNAKGLCGDHAPLRGAYDGVTYFGCKKKALVNVANTNEGSLAGMIHDTFQPENTPSDQAQKIIKTVVNDFVIPAVKPEEKDKHMGRQFSIRYEPDKDDFLVRDLGVGYGVFTETIGLIPLKDNQLVNMGESYLVTNIIPATEDECSDYN
jgi:hypothetical protein